METAITVTVFVSAVSAFLSILLIVDELLKRKIRRKAIAKRLEEL